MRRLHLIEIEDQPWCPAAIRDAMTDYLQFVLDRARPYSAVAPRLRAALEHAGTCQVVDLCSGGGGPWASLVSELGDGVSVRLTDRYPNLEAFARVRGGSGGRVEFEPAAVDATAVPVGLTGFRTLFSGFHHFRPDSARRILQDAIGSRQGIGVFEATQRSPAAILGMLLVPLIVLLVTPAIRPFRWSRLFWTYLMPAVPLFALFDGIVSCLRTYTPAELRELVAGLNEYAWEIGEEKSRGPALPVTYLIGWLAGRETS